MRVGVGGLREEKEGIDPKGRLKNPEVGFSTVANVGNIEMSVGTFSFIPERVIYEVP